MLHLVSHPLRTVRPQGRCGGRVVHRSSRGGEAGRPAFLASSPCRDDPPPSRSRRGPWPGCGRARGPTCPRPLDLDGAGRRSRPRARGGGSVGRESSGADLDDPGHRGGRHTRVPHPRAWVRLPAAFVGARWQPAGRRWSGSSSSRSWPPRCSGCGWRGPSPPVRARSSPPVVGRGPVRPGSPPGPSRSGPSRCRVRRPWRRPAPTPGGGGTPPSTTGVPTASGVVVHVVGQVRTPGLRRLPPGSRVADAVDAAGGATAKADLGRVNLARVLVDGEQVRVPAPGDPVDPVSGTGAGGAAEGQRRHGRCVGGVRRSR